ncbi:hypothetical protein GFL91_27815 [Rhizobium leguminosarum bv. viciae]|jgi:hypothetical protein|uniref:Transmembrane protein n=1 Tax=Rhizobium leguminosarum bv. viciae TaxID=387 RepID=A0A8I2H0H3_RHILV|nr:hypothetical protein [Rhizobium leguminosarum]ASR07524.1 hypothetical protein CHY08_10645 [Rhizobium leguminosarum bv. viciae]MBY5753118.1 hypothetical protein [Rhizobium leguminosarum]MBY5795259.1 hypothetical protein [Rhizobium leguminosarum]NKM48699.1 hypothetical protein [Rhizobium leguminosarum bv. viciae]
MSDCLIKSFSGCACPPGECAKKPVTPPPVTFVSWRLQAIGCLTFGFLAAIVSAAWMETQLKTRDLRNQEQVSWK